MAMHSIQCDYGFKQNWKSVSEFDKIYWIENRKYSESWNSGTKSLQLHELPHPSNKKKKKTNMLQRSFFISFLCIFIIVPLFPCLKTINLYKKVIFVMIQNYLLKNSWLTALGSCHVRKYPSNYKNNKKNYRKKSWAVKRKHSYLIILSGSRILIDWTNANMYTLKIVLFSLFLYATKSNDIRVFFRFQ